MAAPIKVYKNYADQVEQLTARGMDVGDPSDAIAKLKEVSYYRLSGYWYPFRQLTSSERADEFFPGTTLSDVTKLYDFDVSLRVMTFAALSPIEVSVRALLGHELGRVHECAHLEQSVLNARAQQPEYEDWLKNYTKELARSREDFVAHHLHKYGGASGVGRCRDSGLGRVDSAIRVNRVLPAPKLPNPGRYPDLDASGPFTRTFGQLSLIQHLLRSRSIGNRKLLPSTLGRYPEVRLVPITHLGANAGWEQSPLWS